MFFTDDWDPGRMMNGSSSGGMYGGGMWMFMIFGLLFLVLAGVAIFWVARAAGSTSTGPASATQATGSPRDVVDLRLARGEITPEEHGTIRTLLDP